MADLKWFARRLSAMGPREILWRVQQKILHSSENRKYRTKRPVTDGPSCPGHAEKLFLNTGNRVYTLHTAIPLLAPYNYSEYKTAWHAGFQTDNEWPLVPSTKLDFRGMDAVGDARTNWELNKHFQFALLAKNYRASGDRRYLEELLGLFHDWNEKNPFLWGISWTSGIEIAERTMNWCYMLGFLEGAPDVPGEFIAEVTAGIANMGAYLLRHYSRYSSANNHLIIEISAVLHAGIILGRGEWTDKAVKILDRELFLQDHEDGVNKEEALYYQVFMMEAYAMDLRLLLKNAPAPACCERWIPMLTRMSRYVRDCIGRYGEIVEFGDNDDGKLLDLEGCADGSMDPEAGRRHYAYLLQFMSLLLPERYVSEEDAWSLPFAETIRWLFSDEELAEALRKPLYSVKGSVDYAVGGNAVLRSADEEVVIGIDHAPLGYGALCAHGHADALSFIAFERGRAVLCDPGTYIYHTDEEARNDFRRTSRHNTVCVGGRDQSEMLGAFLWGKKAACHLIAADLGEERDEIVAEHDGYRPVMHRRRFLFDRREKRLTIEDTVRGAEDAVFSLLLAPDIRAERVQPAQDREEADGAVWRCTDRESGVPVMTIAFQNGFGESALTDREISPVYGVKTKTTGLSAAIRQDQAVCEISFCG